jgi:hypothetical protein
MNKVKDIDDQITLPTEWVSLDCVDIPANRREFDEATVKSLVDSIGKIGLLHPITVREHFDAEGDQHIDLVSGRNRLEALRRLGIGGTDCLIINEGDNPLLADLVEIDENLCRANLSPAQEAAAITRRKQVYESLHPETRAGVAGGKARQGSASDTVSFAASTARATGKNKRTVERAAARGKAIGVDNLGKIANTSLDKHNELDALAAAPPTEQADLIERAAAGEQVTARRGNDVDAPASAELRKVENAALLDDARAMRDKFAEASRKARSARASQEGLAKQLMASLAEAAALRDRVDTLQREIAWERNENASLRAAAMKERQRLDGSCIDAGAAASGPMIDPITRCTMTVRRLILEIAYDLKPAACSDLICALREVLDDVTNIISKRD